jgi:hypothetical protein
MQTENTLEQSLALTFAAAWHHLESRLDQNLGAIRGISLAEYRLLNALGNAPGSQASRVDLAQALPGHFGRWKNWESSRLSRASAMRGYQLPQ